MNSVFTIGALLLFAGWIVVAYGLAQKRLNDAYSKHQNEEKK